MLCPERRARSSIGTTSDNETVRSLEERPFLVMHNIPLWSSKSPLLQLQEMSERVCRDGSHTEKDTDLLQMEDIKKSSAVEGDACKRVHILGKDRGEGRLMGMVSV